QFARVAGLGVRVVLGREPEERAVLRNRPANAATTQIVGALRLGHAGNLAEVVVGLAPDRAGLDEGAALPQVGPRAQRGVEDTAAGAAHFGVVGVHLHLHI